MTLKASLRRALLAFPPARPPSRPGGRVLHNVACPAAATPGSTAVMLASTRVKSRAMETLHGYC